ncbi:MAG: hypothetical protein K9M82_08055 [Deltaproteobacteria bacterium]|nr:hypothetical protein [Deltaproteobacteria bacterium]
MGFLSPGRFSKAFYCKFLRDSTVKVSLLFLVRSIKGGMMVTSGEGFQGKGMTRMSMSLVARG